MVGETIPVKLKDICTKIGSGATPRGGKEAYFTSGISLIRSQNVQDFSFSYDGLAFINDEQAAQLYNVTIQENDVLINITGDSVARVCIVPKEVLPARVNQHVSIIRPNSRADSKYLLYFLQHEKPHLLSIGSCGGTRNALTKEMLENLELDLPTIEQQKRISAILSSLDDKIELNNRIIANLEAQAQAIFNEWFMAVDIDFPVGVLSDIAEVNPTRTLLKGQLATYIEMSSLSTGNSFPDNWVENTPFNGGMKFKNGDTLIARITPCLENGKTAFISCLDDGAVGFGSTEYVVLSAKTGYCNEMLYFLARNEDFRNYAIQNMNGSSGRQRVSGETIGNYEMAVPTKEASKEFETFAKPIMETIHNCAMQNRKLAQTRDALLPKLMSGEIEVPEEDEGWHQ